MKPRRAFDRHRWLCVKMGAEGLARPVSKRLPALGLLANPVAFPAAAKGAARFRMQVMG